MKKKTQKDAVYEIVKELLGEKYSPNEDMRPYFGSRDSREGQIYKETYESNSLMSTAVDLFLKKIENGEVNPPKSRTNNFNHLSKEWFARNTIYNWLRKDKRLNGGTATRKFEEIAIEKELNQVMNITNHPSYKKLASNKALEESFKLIHSGNLGYKDFLYTKNHIIAQILEILQETNKKAA